jgi:outer membrane receptor for ferrienterochelin and colicins
MLPMRVLLVALIIGIACNAQGQNTFRTSIRNTNDEPLPGATLTWNEGRRSVIADSSGAVLLNGLPDGMQTFTVTHIGYARKEFGLLFPLRLSTDVTLEPEAEGEEEEVIVTATRTSRTIANTPTRTEVISGEELEEKGNMKPGDIRMLLNESTGIQTQQTSATSYSAGIRIQGLEGRYTQLLRDGYPLYAGFSGGLSLLQIAPLDLQQVEVIKGSASTLYGGGAIAGLVNLVSKTPRDKRELQFLANATSAGGLDLSGFYSQKFGTWGTTIFASRNSTAPYDPAGIGLTAIPKSERYSIHPRLFYFGKKIRADIGISYTTEDRSGGSTEYIKHGGSGWFERNESDHVVAQAGITYSLGERSSLQLKNSASSFDRTITIPGYHFDATQIATFSELTWSHRRAKSQWVAGANFITDDLRQRRAVSDTLLDYHLNTTGLFVQHTWSPDDRFTLESGLRADYVDPYGLELLPRISMLYRFTPKFVVRIGGGAGYKTPTPFTEESERRQFRSLWPIDPSYNRNERSIGGNVDINYSTRIGAVRVAANLLLFNTRLNHPLRFAVFSNGQMILFNSNGSLSTQGVESNFRFVFRDFKLFVGYTFTDATYSDFFFGGDQPLTPRHRLNNVLMWEQEGKWKVGLEAYYYSRQLLSDDTYGKPYWITGLMAERLWKKFSLFVNFENFSNTRQSRFDRIYTGTIENPVFRDIYAPVEGFVVNGGVKLRL